MNPKDKPPARDYRQEVTNDIIRLIEEARPRGRSPGPQAKPPACPTIPPRTSPTRAATCLRSWLPGCVRAMLDPQWMTYKQAADKG
jgi:hypothetical protein